MSDKMTYANNADPDKTAPGGAVWSGSTLFAIQLSFFKKQLHKKQNLGQSVIKWNKVFEISGHLLYMKCIPLS